MELYILFLSSGCNLEFGCLMMLVFVDVGDSVVFEY